MRMLTLPTDSNTRKDVPMWRGCVRYFPAALAAVARWSKIGNDKHNPGEDMHHARGKSNDHADCIVRHMTDIEDILSALGRHEAGSAPSDELVRQLLDEAAALGWRSLALSQDLHERFGGAPLAPGAKLPAPPKPATVVGRLVVQVDIDAAITKLRRQMASVRRSRGNKKPRRR